MYERVLTISSFIPLIWGQEEEENGSILINSEVIGKVCNVLKQKPKRPKSIFK